MKHELKYDLATVDMTEIYTALLARHDAIPEVQVFTDLGKYAPIVRGVTRKGSEIYYLQQRPDMVDILMRELDNPSAEIISARDTDEYTLSDIEHRKWISCILQMSRMYGINCPQIAFFDELSDSSAICDSMIIIPLRSHEIPTVFRHVAFALRRVWLYYQPEFHVQDWYSSTNISATMGDAEAYAVKLTEELFGVRFSANADLNTVHSVYQAYVQKRYEDIQISLSESEKAEIMAILYDNAA